MFLVAKILFFSEEKENKSTKNVKTLKEVLFADFPKSGFLSYFGGNLWLDIFHLYVYFEQRNGKMRVKWKNMMFYADNMKIMFIFATS